VSITVITLIVLIGTLVLGGIRTDLNAGVIATAAALVIGAIIGFGPTQVAGFLPAQLIVTIVGVALFFELASGNGTLERVTGYALRLVGGQGRWLPLAFFGLSFALSALGPGNIAATALVAPIAMRAALEAGVSPVLMAIMICTGANAGAFSPVALTGNINTGLLQEIGIIDSALPLIIFAAVAAIQSMTAVAAYLIFGGWRAAGSGRFSKPSHERLRSRHRLTLAFMLAFIVAVMVLRLPASTSAFALASLMMILKLGDAERAIKGLPWSVILLVSGISLLLELLEKTGGLELATTVLARYASPHFLNALLAFVCGLASLGSSSSGVVMPLFVPLAPGLLEKVGGGNLLEAVIAIDVGSHMVDVSPLSTLGALCLAALPDGFDRSSVFRPLLIWGLGMAFVGALLAFVFLDLL
jgi:Na+/H+ antiporter NhaD/arsenite permease-like protein